MNHIIDINHTDCGYTLRNLKSCSKKAYGNNLNPFYAVGHFS